MIRFEVLGDASKWSGAEFIDRLAEECGKRRLYKAAHARLTHSPKWREQADRVMALCDREGISPVLYAEAVAELLGHAANRRGHPINPYALASPRTISLYNEWLAKRRKSAGAGDATRTAEDRFLMAEEAYIRVYVSALLSGQKPVKAATEAASLVRDDYSPDKRRRVVALCYYLHSLHPELPDMIALRSGWKVGDVLRCGLRLFGVLR